MLTKAAKAVKIGKCVYSRILISPGIWPQVEVVMKEICTIRYEIIDATDGRRNFDFMLTSNVVKQRH